MVTWAAQCELLKRFTCFSNLFSNGNLDLRFSLVVALIDLSSWSRVLLPALIYVSAVVLVCGLVFGKDLTPCLGLSQFRSRLGLCLWPNLGFDLGIGLGVPRPVSASS